MAGGMKSLAKDTAVYGLSSIVGRFLNWCLVPMYVRTLSEIDYGVYSNVYGYTALFLILLTYGMETGFFRFINKEGENPAVVYSTTLLSIGRTSIFFMALCLFLAYFTPLAEILGYGNHREYISIMTIVVALDAFASIPFAYLRYKNKSKTFAGIKLFNIFITIILNIFFLVLCPIIYKWNPSSISWFYNPDYGVGYVFVANLIGTIIVLLMLVPYMRGFKYISDKKLLSEMLKYSFPLLILGIAGVLNQSVDKILYPFLFEDKQEAFRQLGIYGACFRMAVVMAMFTQAFRFAYEPFVFSKKGKDKDKSYPDAMKYFIIFSLIIFLGVSFYLDVLKYFLTETYFEGLPVVPIVMMGYVFFGIYFNLSFWYKLIDKTHYGAVFSIVGCVLTVAINVIFVPLYGYMASAWASFICNFIMMVLSYYFGQKYHPINYDMKRIGMYFLIASIAYIFAFGIEIEYLALRLLFRTFLLFLFLAVVIKKDLPLSELPLLNKLTKKNPQK